MKAPTGRAQLLFSARSSASGGTEAARPHESTRATVRHGIVLLLLVCRKDGVKSRLRFSVNCGKLPAQSARGDRQAFDRGRIILLYCIRKRLSVALHTG